MQNQKNVADRLLWGLWRSVSPDYKEQYKADSWEHFENAIRSAAYTSSLKEFLTYVKSRIPMAIQAQFQKDILSVVESGQDDQILGWLREETPYMVMLVRVLNQNRQDEYREKQKKQELEIEDSSSFLDEFQNENK